MFDHQTRPCGLILAIVIVITAQCAATADASEAVRDTLADVERLFTGHRNGPGWRRFLLLDQLREQTNKGAAADRDVIARIHDRFVRGGQVYPRSEVTTARDAIGNWRRALDAPTLQDLPQLARTFTDSLRSPSTPQLRKQRAVAQQYVETLHHRIPPSEKMDEWRRFLGIPNARSHLGNDKRIDAHLLELIALRHAAVAPMSNEAGLWESAQVLQTTAEMFRSADVSKNDYRLKVEQLAEALEQYAKQPKPTGAAPIVETLAWLDRHGQAPELVSAVRTHFDSPNLFLRASRDLIGAGVDTPINEQLAIDEVIQGNRHTGTGTATGQVRVGLVPDSRKLSLQLEIESDITSYTSTYQESVFVDSQSTTNVSASEAILFDQRGVKLMSPFVRVRSNSEIVNISMDGRIFGRRVAERRVYEQKGASDEEAQQKTRNRVRNEINQLVTTLVEPVDNYYLRYIRLPLLIRGNFPRNLHTRTTDDFVEIALTQANPSQWSLAATPPPLDEHFDLSVRMHESFVSNLTAGIWPGATVSEDKLQAQLEKLFGKSPEGLKVADPGRVWTVTFDEQQPVSAMFDRSTITFQLRTSRFTVGDKSYPGMWMTVRYEIAPGTKSFTAVRQGRLEIVPPGFDPSAGSRLGARQQALRSILRKRFERVFPDQWSADPITLTGNWKKAGRLTVAHLTADDGWLTAGFRLPASNAQSRR